MKVQELNKFKGYDSKEDTASHFFYMLHSMLALSKDSIEMCEDQIM